jgi:hypothetical protein
MSLKTIIPRETRNIGRAYVSPFEQAQERGVRIQAKAYRSSIVAKDAVASREFLNSVRTRTVLRNESVIVKEAFSDVKQAQTMEDGQPPGFRPSVRAIQRWMGFRGIGGGKSVAFAIAITIERRGIKGRQVARTAFEDSKAQVIAEFEKAARQTTGAINKK